MHKKVLGVVGSVFFVLSHAQNTNFDPTQEFQRQDRQRQELRQRAETQPWLSSGPKAETSPSERLPSEQPCVVIQRVEVQGTLSSVVEDIHLNGPSGEDPPQGKCLGSQGITLLIQRLQQALVEQGYITSQVHVPEQDLNTGTLTLQVKEGRVARIRSEIAGISPPRWTWAVQEGEILNLRDIEQSSENFQRLPSWQTEIQIEPSQVIGSSDVVANITSQFPLRLSLSADDGGLKTTGKIQGNATLSWDSPLGLADTFYLIQGKELGDRTDGPRGSRNQIAHYSLPIGYWTVGFTWSGSQSNQTVYGPYQAYVYHGTSSNRELSVSRVLQRNGKSKTTANIKSFLRQSNNYIDDLEVLVQRRRTAGWEASLQHMHYVSSGTLNTQLTYRHGTAAFGALPAPEEMLGEGTGRMHVMTGVLSWMTPFNTSGHPWQYSTQLQWQWASTRLTPQDRFCLGSRTTVRGFDEQQTLCGDRGQLWRQEVMTAIQAVDNAQVYAAFDTGRVTTPGDETSHPLSGAAIGFRGQKKIAGNYTLQWDVFLGKPLSFPEGFTTTKPAAGFSLRAEF